MDGRRVKMTQRKGQRHNAAIRLAVNTVMSEVDWKSRMLSSSEKQRCAVFWGGLERDIEEEKKLTTFLERAPTEALLTSLEFCSLSHFSLWGRQEEKYSFRLVDASQWCSKLVSNNRLVLLINMDAQL